MVVVVVFHVLMVVVVLVSTALPLSPSITPALFHSCSQNLSFP